VSWYRPVKEKCPECQSMMVEKSTKNKKELKCTNEECGYKKIEG
jgi:DNA topoisomerase-1